MDAVVETKVKRVVFTARPHKEIAARSAELWMSESIYEIDKDAHV
jgi:hypothetical protein